jgi:probable rRNA maturation factor
VTKIDIANQQKLLPVDRSRLRAVVRAILAEEFAGKATISVAIVDDEAIAKLNEEFLGHEGPADVLSFVLEKTDDQLDGEVVVSAETAQRVAPRFGWSPWEELLLYVIHGTLHLIGYDDATPKQRASMRRRETDFLARFSIQARYKESIERGGR